MAAPTGAEAEKLKNIWAQATHLVKQRAVQPTLYRALENSIAIAYEEGNFVVGIMPGGDGMLTRALNTAEYQAIIERALRDLTANPGLRFRYIEGNDYSDWEHTRHRDAALQAQQSAVAVKRAADAGTSNSWDELHDQVARLWGAAEGRSSASGRGRYLNTAIALVLETMERLYPAEGKPGEATERGLSRVVERVASYTNSDPAMIAFLIFERRSRAQQAAE